MYQVVVGFADEIVGNLQSPWTDDCYGNALGLYYTAAVDVPTSYDDERYHDMIVAVTKVLRHVHPLALACIESADDYYEKMLVYWETWQTPVLLGFNALYHMGDVYTYIEDMVGLIVSPSLNWEGWQEIGRSLGRVCYLLLYNIGDFPFPDVEVEYPIEFWQIWETHIETDLIF